MSMRSRDPRCASYQVETWSVPSGRRVIVRCTKVSVRNHLSAYRSRICTRSAVPSRGVSVPAEVAVELEAALPAGLVAHAASRSPAKSARLGRMMI